MCIKRNDKCPCNSGKKYKHCHLVIEKLKKQMERNNLHAISITDRKKLQAFDRDNMKRFFESKGKKCQFPNCDRKPIKSHTFPRNLLEKQIAGRTSNGYSVFSTDIKSIISNLQNPDLHNELFYEININDAGTMPLFCKEHDSHIFSPIEILKPIPSVKQYLFLYSYCFFLYHYLKENYALKAAYEDTLDSEKGVGKSLSSAITQKRNIIYDNAIKIANTKTNISNLEVLKTKFDKVIKKIPLTDTEIDRHFKVYAFKLKNKPIKWCGAGCTEISYNDSLVTKHLGCSFGLIPNNKVFSAYFYCVVPNEENDYLNDKLLKLLKDEYVNYNNGENDSLFENIIKYYIFDSSENIIVSPGLIDKLKRKSVYDSENKIFRYSQYDSLIDANHLLTQVKGIDDSEKRNKAFKILSKVELF